MNFKILYVNMNSRYLKDFDSFIRTVLLYYRHMSKNEELLRLLNDLSHIIRFRMDKVSGQKRILIILNQEGVITQRDLTERLGVQSGSVSETLEKLERSELIYRIPSESDRRTADIFLTQKGRELSEKIKVNYEKEQDRLFTSLSDSEKDQLFYLLNKLYKDWDILYPQRDYHKIKDHGYHRGHHHHHFKGPKKHKF